MQSGYEFESSLSYEFIDRMTDALQWLFHVNLEPQQHEELQQGTVAFDTLFPICSLFFSFPPSRSLILLLSVTSPLFAAASRLNQFSFLFVFCCKMHKTSRSTFQVESSGKNENKMMQWNFSWSRSISAWIVIRVAKVAGRSGIDRCTNESVSQSQSTFVSQQQMTRATTQITESAD